MTMTDDLVKRLRAHSHWGMTAEAAARIESLTAELDARVQTSAIYCDDCGWAMKFPDCGCVYCGFHRLEKERDALTADRRFILKERDRTFALMLARAEGAEADNIVLRKLLTEAAADLTAYVNAEHPWDTCAEYPHIAKRHYRDMELVRHIEAALNTGKADT